MTSLAADGGLGWIWGPGLWWFPTKIEHGVHSREGGRSPGEESGEGEVLVAPEWPGQWRRQELPERKKTTSLVFLLLWVGR